MSCGHSAGWVRHACAPLSACYASSTNFTRPCTRVPSCQGRSLLWRLALLTCKLLTHPLVSLARAHGSLSLWKGIFDCPCCLSLGCWESEAEPVLRSASYSYPRTLHQADAHPPIETCTLLLPDTGSLHQSCFGPGAAWDSGAGCVR